MTCDTDNPIHVGLLSGNELREFRGLFDELCLEMNIAGHAARDMAAGLMITMVANGQRDVKHLRDAIRRFAAELPAAADPQVQQTCR